MDDDWVKAASSDCSLVAELLIRLHHSPPPPPPPPPATLPLKWSVRQPRTRSLAHKAGVARGSPTTPLSWTGGSTSLSGGAAAVTAVDGSEESSRPGSKLTATNEATISKRSRKKKTMIEMKEEEILMQKENKELKRTLESVLANLGKKQSENSKLKRIKLDLASLKPNTKCTVKKTTFSKYVLTIVPPSTQEASAALPAPVPPITQEASAALPAPSSLPNKSSEVDGGFDKFEIPDLNVAFVESNEEGPSEMKEY